MTDRPAEHRAAMSVVGENLKLDSMVSSAIDGRKSPHLLADVDPLAESLRGRFAVQVVVDDEGHRRTTPFRSLGAAERTVARACRRDRVAHVTLVQLVPVGVVWVGDTGRSGESGDVAR